MSDNLIWENEPAPTIQQLTQVMTTNPSDKHEEDDSDDSGDDSLSEDQYDENEEEDEELDSDEEQEIKKERKKDLAPKKDKPPKLPKLAPRIKVNVVDLFTGISGIKWPCNIGIFGQTNTYKTTLMQSIVRMYAQEFNRIILFSKNAYSASQHVFLPKEFIITKPTENQVRTILDEQENGKCQGVKTLLIFDDIIGCFNMTRKGNVFDELCSSGRHVNISIIIISQEIKQCSPVIRNNLGMAFVTQIKEHGKKCLFELSTAFETFAQFNQFYKEYCVKGNILRLNLMNDGQSPQVIFKSEKCKKFKIQI